MNLEQSHLCFVIPSWEIKLCSGLAFNHWRKLSEACGLSWGYRFWTCPQRNLYLKQTRKEWQDWISEDQVCTVSHWLLVNWGSDIRTKYFYSHFLVAQLSQNFIWLEWKVLKSLPCHKWIASPKLCLHTKSVCTAFKERHWALLSTLL